MCILCAHIDLHVVDLIEMSKDKIDLNNQDNKESNCCEIR